MPPSSLSYMLWRQRPPPPTIHPSAQPPPQSCPLRETPCEGRLWGCDHSVTLSYPTLSHTDISNMSNKASNPWHTLSFWCSVHPRGFRQGHCTFKEVKTESDIYLPTATGAPRRTPRGVLNSARTPVCLCVTVIIPYIKTTRETNLLRTLTLNYLEVCNVRIVPLLFLIINHISILKGRSTQTQTVITYRRITQ